MSAKIADKRTLTNLDEIRGHETVWYSAKTCWWTTRSEDLCCAHGMPMKGSNCPDGDGIPLDPSGSPLLMAETMKFLANAEGRNLNDGVYGKHGIDAFILAYHGNVIEVIRASGKDDVEWPRCAVEWDMYNDLLDGAK